jgi:hypothetical protein
MDGELRDPGGDGTLEWLPVPEIDEEDMHEFQPR